MTEPISALKKNSSSTVSGDIFGGFASMLVALPSAIAFGLIIYAPLGGDSAAKGALAGIIGTVVLGLIAPVFGGTPRLVSAPCAPAAALLSMFALDLIARGDISVQIIPLYIALVGFGAGLIQVIAGALKGGRFIKYIPYPVVTGYLSGVGLLIFIGQIPKFLGLSKDITLTKAFFNPSLWQSESMIIGTVTIVVMLLTPKIIKVIPASIAALICGVSTYFIIAYFNPSLLSLEGNKLVIGSINASIGDLGTLIAGNVSSLASIHLSTISMIIVPVISLGVLLSIDTLKTCVVLDVLTGYRHNSNRELFGQGLANITSSVFGGVPGAGQMGGTIVNIFSGGRTRLSGFIEGVSSLVVLLLLSRFISWIPIASLAGVLLVVGIRMIDRKSIQLLRHRSTIFDFAVILAVIISALSFSLITAAGVGIAFAIVLFLRDQIRFPVVRRCVFGSQTFSKKNRPTSEQVILEEKGAQTLVAELQGQLFFGTTDQLYTEIEPHFATCRYFIFDMRRVLSIDFTAANMLSQLKKKIIEHNGMMIFSSIPKNLPTGQNPKKYLKKLGFVEEIDKVKFFPVTDDALEWVEEEYLREAFPERAKDHSLSLADFDFFKGVSETALSTLATHLTEKFYKDGEIIFSLGDAGGEIYFIKKGSVRIELPLANGTIHHLATFGRGAFFGDMSFLDNEPRSANARAVGEVKIYLISRAEFDYITEKYPDVGGIFFERLSLEISRRLRLNIIELKALEEN